jgi:hypothetical protein
MTIRPAARDDLSAIAALIRELADYEELAHEVEWTDPQVLAEHLFGPLPAPHHQVPAAPDGAGGGIALWLTTI